MLANSEVSHEGSTALLCIKQNEFYMQAVLFPVAIFIR